MSAASSLIVVRQFSTGARFRSRIFPKVNTKIVTRRGEEIALNYKLHKMDGDWKVYDVVIENISMVNNLSLSV